MESSHVNSRERKETPIIRRRNPHATAFYRRAAKRGNLGRGSFPNVVQTSLFFFRANPPAGFFPIHLKSTCEILVSFARIDRDNISKRQYQTREIRGESSSNRSNRSKRNLVWRATSSSPRGNFPWPYVSPSIQARNLNITPALLLFVEARLRFPLEQGDD